MKKSVSSVREVACFAGVFLVVHFLLGILFDYGLSSDAPEGAERWEPVLDQLAHSVVTVAVATPVYVGLMFLYRRHQAKKGRETG